MSKLDLETKHIADYEVEDYEANEEPLHVKVASLLEKASLLWADRKRLLTWTFVSMFATLGLMFLIPNQYKAATVLNPPDMNPMSGLTMMIGLKSGLASGLGSAMGGMLGMKSQGQVYIQQMQSRVVLDALVRRFDLQKVYKTKKMEDTRKALLGRCEFKEDKKSGLINIYVLDEDPNRAAQLANAFAEELGNLQAGMNAQSGRLERQYFEAELFRAKEDFRHASDELSKYGGQKGALDIESEGKALAEAVATIEGQLIATRTELKGLQQIYTDNNVQVVQAKARIAHLEEELAKMSAGSQAQEKKGTSNSDAQASNDLTLQRMWGQATPYLDKYAEVKIQEAVVATLAEQYEIAKLQEGHRVSSVQVMDPAQPPQKKARPHRATMAVVVGFLVFVFLSSRILIRDKWNRMTPEDPWRQTLEPIVAKMHADSARRRWKFGRSRAPEPRVSDAGSGQALS